MLTERFEAGKRACDGLRPRNQNVWTSEEAEVASIALNAMLTVSLPAASSEKCSLRFLLCLQHPALPLFAAAAHAHERSRFN